MIKTLAEISSLNYSKAPSKEGSFFVAKKRMFSNSIVQSDVFLDMPLSTQSLYFHLSMNADDDGFVSPRRIMRMIGANADDLKLLLAKRFVLGFESEVVVIKHWLINNSKRKDRSTPTTYNKELSSLTYNEYGAYTERRKIISTIADVEKATTNMIQKTGVADNVATAGKPNGNQMATQIRLDKIRLDNKLPKGSYVDQNKIKKIFEYYLECFGANPNLVKLSDSRKGKLKSRLNDIGEENLKKAIQNTSKSPFHRGDNDRGWKANLDWIIKSYEQVERLAEMELVTHETAKNGKVKAPSLEEIRKNFENI